MSRAICLPPGVARALALRNRRLERNGLMREPGADVLRLSHVLVDETIQRHRLGRHLAVAALLGYSERQAQRWWRLYTTEGLEAWFLPPNSLYKKNRKLSL